MKRFTNHPEPWGEFIDVKHWPEIKNAKKYAGKEAFFGSVTDCYQPHEAKYKRTRTLLEQLQGSGISVSIATKSDLVLRDLGLIKTFPHARVSWSINTLDESFRREMDRGVSIERRLEAMRQFYEAGVETTCFISPIFPGITDVEAVIRKAKDCDSRKQKRHRRFDHFLFIEDWFKSLQSVSEGYSSIDYMKHLQLTIVRPKSSNLL